MYVQVRMYMHIHVLYVDGWMDGVRNIGSAVKGTTHILQSEHFTSWATNYIRI